MAKRLTDAPVLVVNFGAQYAQLIARRVREAHCYSEIVSHAMPVATILAKKPAAIILSGGPSSVYEPGAPVLDPALFDSDVPIFGICYGLQAMAVAMGGEVGHTGGREFGRTEVSVDASCALFDGQPGSQVVWMSHNDAVVKAPPGARVVAETAVTPVAGFIDASGKRAGVQWHPEVLHSTFGQKVLEHFLYDIANIAPTWTTTSVLDEAVASVQAQIGDGTAICGLSGGVDSAVAAALVHRAIGDRLTCVFVDHGLLREGEREQVINDVAGSSGMRLHTVDATERFLSALAGVTDPERKRKIIGEAFIRVFESAANAIAQTNKGATFLVQGTLYPDVVESGDPGGGATIKSHHNVGGLPEDLSFELVEPLRTLFKDEVRTLGLELGLPESIVYRHPFPGPGLAIRIVGAVDAERIRILRRADAIARDELTQSGLDREIWQFPVVLLADVRSVGVQGDGRTYGHPIVLRPVSSEDAMTADWSRLPYELLERISTRITNEVPEVNRVVLDVTSKPPGTIEWE